jgi:hypothetical protein
MTGISSKGQTASPNGPKNAKRAKSDDEPRKKS